jgi:hypothetical protein
MNVNDLSWLKVFYIVGALMLLTISILVYPTLKKKNK